MPENSVQTIPSSSSEEPLNSIQKKHILLKVHDSRRVYVHDLCELARSGGRFERLTLTLLAVMVFCLGLYSDLGLLVSRPVHYECDKRANGRSNWVACDKDEACGKYRSHHLVVFPEFRSVEQQFELFCDKQDLPSMLRAIKTLSSPLSCWAVAYLADFMGRRKALMLALLVGGVGFMLSYFASGFSVYVIGNCCLDSFQSCSLMLVFLYANEILGRGLRSRAVGLLLVFFTLGQLVLLGTYDLMTSFRQILLLQVGVAWVLGPILRFLRESPFHLVRSLRFRELSKTLKKILETNFGDNVVD